MSQKEDIEAKEAKNAAKLQKRIKTGGPKKIVEPWIKDFIKSHAKTSPKEIYGWLIGRESQQGEIYVFSALACHRYIKQNYIGAAPDPVEIQELGSNLPQGVGMVGIYHSHPAEIFHSSVDDRTLKNMGKMYPKLLSAVTNADEFDNPAKNETRWFQLAENGDNTNEIEVHFESIPNDMFYVVAVYGFIDFDVKVPIKGKLVQQVVRILMAKYDNIWNNGILQILKMSSKEKKKTDDWGIAPIQNIFTDLKLKPLQEIKVQDIKDSDIDYFKSSGYILQMKFKLSNINEDKPEHTVRIKGTIPMLAMNIFDKNNKNVTIQTILDKIKMEFRDEYLQKLSRGLLKIDRSDDDSSKAILNLITQSPITLPYPGIPFKINLLLDDIEMLHNQVSQSIKDNLSLIPNLTEQALQSSSQLVDMESNILDSLSKRARLLASTGFKNIAKELLIRIKNIYELRKEKSNLEKIKSLISLVKQL